ncbi:MAG: hypothetical protein U0133_12595 [Gemmatimonadales bacterium]
MQKSFAAALALAMLVGCGKKDGQQSASADSLSRDLQLAPAESTTAINDRPSETPPAATPSTSEPAPSTAKPAAPKPKPTTPAPTPSKPAPPAPKAVSLDSGVVVTASAVDSLHSRHNKAGETFTATVSEDVKDAKGNVVIPAGSTVTFNVAVLEPAPNKSAKDGKIRLEATSISIDGESRAISGTARTATVEHDLVGQGVTAGGAARVGAGAAGGAIAGKVIGGKTGAIIGGIAGAAGGAVLASKTADRDVVVRPGMKVEFTLGSTFTVTR